MGVSTSRLDATDTPPIDIPSHGRIEGISVVDTETGKIKAHRYTGVPYALPPVGKRRWKSECMQTKNVVKAAPDWPLCRASSTARFLSLRCRRKKVHYFWRHLLSAR